jgi:hypothetical protein
MSVPSANSSNFSGSEGDVRSLRMGCRTGEALAEDEQEAELLAKPVQWMTGELRDELDRRPSKPCRSTQPGC